MKKAIAGAIVLTLAACTDAQLAFLNQQIDRFAPGGGSTPAQPASPGASASPAEFQPIEFSGDREIGLTEAFRLERGLYAATATHEGSKNFLVALNNDRGESVSGVSYLFVEQGYVDKSTNFFLENPGKYRLRVNYADGPWKVVIKRMEK